MGANGGETRMLSQQNGLQAQIQFVTLPSEASPMSANLWIKANHCRKLVNGSAKGRRAQSNQTRPKPKRARYQIPPKDLTAPLHDTRQTIVWGCVCSLFNLPYKKYNYIFLHFPIFWKFNKWLRTFSLGIWKLLLVGQPAKSKEISQLLDRNYATINLESVRWPKRIIDEQKKG